MAACDEIQIIYIRLFFFVSMRAKLRTGHRGTD